ncbi:MAG: hypothetical protein ACI8PZ_006280 [Myxococcota bacterium]|jgi:hypothetical protein
MAERVRAWLGEHWPSVVALVLMAVVVLTMAPESRDDSHWWRMVLAGVGIVLVAVRVLAAQAAPMALRVVRAVLLAAVVFGANNYYQFDRSVFTGIGDVTDTTYYYLNSKYLAELDYFGLYPAMLLADLEHKKRHAPTIKTYRDLRDYELKSIDVALEHGREIRDTRFTPERWAQFTSDSDWFMRRLSNVAARTNFFVDHGYNPPPTWTLVGGTLAELTPVRKVHWITQIDTLLVGVMLIGVAWAFGWEVMLWSALFYVVTFSGRWPILGQSITRFDWLVMLVLSVCFWKKGRPGAAGAAMAYAALNRIFPAIFFAAWFFTLVRDVWRERRIPEEHVRFMGGAAAVSVVMLGASLALYGPATFQTSAKNLWMHNQTYSSHRVGLGDVLVYKGETTRKQINANGGIAPKEKTIRRMQPLLRGIGLLTLVLLAVMVIRTRRPVYDTVQLAIVPFYCMTNPQINYYNLRILPIIWHASNLKRPEHQLGLAWLLGIELVTQWTKVIGWDRYTTTTTTSLGLLVYVVGLVVWMSVQAARGERQDS